MHKGALREVCVEIHGPTHWMSERLTLTYPRQRDFCCINTPSLKHAPRPVLRPFDQRPLAMEFDHSTTFERPGESSISKIAAVAEDEFHSNSAARFAPFSAEVKKLLQSATN